MPSRDALKVSAEKARKHRLTPTPSSVPELTPTPTVRLVGRDRGPQEVFNRMRNMEFGNDAVRARRSPPHRALRLERGVLMGPLLRVLPRDRVF